MRFLKLYLLSVFALFLLACYDDDEGPEFSFDREISEISVLEDCSTDTANGRSCYKIRYRYPYHLDDYSGLCVWLDTVIVDDTSKAVNNKQIAQAHDSSNKEAFFFEYKTNGRYYDTLDLTDRVAQFIDDGYDSLQVALFCEYSDGRDPGAVQRTVLRFKDNIAPSNVVPEDSVWSKGVLISWDRPTDQTSFHKQGENDGKIFGYNVVIYAIDRPDEDIRDLKVSVQTPKGTDYTGDKFFKRDAQIVRSVDSFYVQNVERSDKVKNYLRLVIFDGEGYNTQDPAKNNFRLIIEGLRTRSNTEDYEYKIGFSAWDEVGNRSGSQGDPQVDPKDWRGFMTTDSIAPLMPKKIFFEEDSLFPGFAKLDSNNHVRIYWNRSVDPLKFKHGISVDSELVIPRGCNIQECYEDVSKYTVKYYNKLDKSWNLYADADKDGIYSRYRRDGKGGFEYDALDTASFISYTIRRVAPGDTIILRLNSVDSSGYKSGVLQDTVFVSPGKLGDELKCPEGFVAVSTSDTTSFCMERYEHRSADGKFMTNVLHSEAVAACEAISASGFEVSLCKERDWELTCLSGGSLPYGVIEEDDKSSDYLFRYCNVSTGNASIAEDIAKRDPQCMNPMGVRDLPGQFQEWVMGRSEDSVAVVKGSSYMIYEGLDRESIAYCTNRAFPYYTRPGYTQDTVYLYREGTKVDTVYAADTTRTLYQKLTTKDFKDTLQFYDVIDANGKVIGKDFSLYSEYKKGGDAWLDSLANGLTYKPTTKEAVFLTGEKLYYRAAASFYKSSTIGFRCCAYKK